MFGQRAAGEAGRTAKGATFVLDRAALQVVGGPLNWCHSLAAASRTVCEGREGGEEGETRTNRAPFHMLLQGRTWDGEAACRAIDLEGGEMGEESFNGHRHQL